MDVSLILKVAGTGLLVSLVYQILAKSGRDEQAMLVSIAGIIIVLMLIIQELSKVVTSIKTLFGI